MTAAGCALANATLHVVSLQQATAASHSACCPPGVFQPGLMHGFIPSWVLDFAFIFGELHEVSVIPFLQLTRIPVNSSPALQLTHSSSQFGIICELTWTLSCCSGY